MTNGHHLNLCVCIAKSNETCLFSPPCIGLLEVFNIIRHEYIQS
jgi:hypothetical protein